jgi:drug/metabolite transporter (DMT)-like permease
VKSLPLVYISLTSTLVPVLTAIISYFHLRKGLNGIDIGVLAVSFVGVIVLIMGATDDSEEVEESVPA